MQIDVVATIGEARSDEFLHKTVIVIDVLRATSTMIAALAHGCRGIVPVETVLQAKELYQQGDLLGGERFCKKIAGFNYGNSPQEYTGADIFGKRLILTTTNGTRGVQKACKAEHLLAGALLNGKACADAAVQFKRDIVILCAGTQDVFALEDGLCAGQLVDEIGNLIGASSVNVNDLGLAMRSSYLLLRANLPEVLLHSSNGKRLSKLGFTHDVNYCAQRDTTHVVPIFRDGMLTPFKAISK
jgi:2-phosphosulfolactate phosphatase